MKTSDNMSGKVMVISGGSRGIGAKTAELYIKKGIGYMSSVATAERKAVFI